MPVFFVSQNPYKAEELSRLSKGHGIELTHVNLHVSELQTMDVNALVRDKTLKAFSKVRYPVLVDHGALVIDCLGGMPGNLTQLFWDRLQGRICSIVEFLGDSKATALTTLGYCDGKRIFQVTRHQSGTISDAPRGSRAFQWDTIFVPDGHNQTYAEMDLDQKNKLSQRSRAFDEIVRIILSGTD